MATPYTNIYNLFLTHISDYDYLGLSDTDLDNSLHDLMLPASAKFIDCNQSLTLDDANSQFDVTLTVLEQEILACYMILEWVKPNIYKTSLLRQNMTDRDFQISSQANMLKSLISLKTDTQSELEHLITRYTYADTTGMQSLATTESYPIVSDYGAIWGENGNGNVGETV